jgi:hypothetical protein
MPKDNDLSTRLIELSEGRAKPETKYERIYLAFYTGGTQGYNLMDLCKDRADELDTFNIDEISAALLGYAYGQATLDATLGLDDNSTGQTAH